MGKMKFYDVISMEGESASVLNAAIKLKFGTLFWITAMNDLHRTLISERVKDYSEE